MTDEKLRNKCAICGRPITYNEMYCDWCASGVSPDTAPPHPNNQPGRRFGGLIASITFIVMKYRWIVYFLIFVGFLFIASALGIFQIGEFYKRVLNWSN